MAYRTGTYIAFDGLGQVNPALSDYKYYNTMRAWDESQHIDFKVTNSHEKTYSVRDTSTPETLMDRINQRLSMSKNFLVILTPQTRETGSVLSFEVEQAIDKYNLPIIAAYPNYNYILDPGSLPNYCPHALFTRIQNQTAKVIHIPFKKVTIFDAISQFGVNGKYPNTSPSYYSVEAYRALGINV